MYHTAIRHGYPVVATQTADWHTYAERMTNFIFASKRSLLSEDDVHDIAGKVLLLIDGKMVTVSDLHGSLAAACFKSDIPEVYRAVLRNAVLDQREQLHAMEYDALYTYANYGQGLEISEEVIQEAVMNAYFPFGFDRMEDSDPCDELIDETVARLGDELFA